MKTNGLRVAGIVLTLMAFLTWAMSDHWLVIVLFVAGLICLFIDAWLGDNFKGMTALIAIAFGSLLMTLAPAYLPFGSFWRTLCEIVGGLLTIGGFLYLLYKMIQRDIAHDKQVWQQFKGRKK